MTRTSKTSKTVKSQTIDDLPEEFLRCRTFGHSWEEFIPVGIRPPEFGIRFSLLCVVCGTERHELIDVHGRVAQRNYDYPDGYQLERRTDRTECRILWDKTRERERLRKLRSRR